jgi:TRAP-type C4-dicarboxylate transport system permease small subunit
MNRFMTIIYRLDISFQIVAGIVLAFMMGVTLTDVVLRFFGKPIVGSIELVCFSGAVVVGFAIPYSSWSKAHVYVDFLQDRFSARAWSVLRVFTRAVGIILFLFIGVNFIFYGLNLMKTGEVSPGLKIPYYPIPFGLALSCFLESLTLFCDLLKLYKAGDYE